MKICVCSFYDDTIKAYAKLTHSINSTFCLKNHIDYCVKHERTLHDRHPAWERIPMILDLLKGSYDYSLY